MSVVALSSLLRLRNLQSNRAQSQLAQARAAQEMAWAEDAATQLRTEQAAAERASVLVDMGRIVGALRDIYHFASLAEDHEALLDAETAACFLAAKASRDCADDVAKAAVSARQAQRAQQKMTELLTISQGAVARMARRTSAMREEINARNSSV